MEDLSERDNLWDTELPKAFHVHIPTGQEIADELLKQKMKGSNKYLGKICGKCGYGIRIIKYAGVSSHTNECFTCERIRTSNRRHRIREEYDSLSKEEQRSIDELVAEAAYLSFITGIEHEVHHIILHADDGKHQIDNLIILTGDEHKEVHRLLYAIKKKVPQDYRDCLEIILAKRS